MKKLSSLKMYPANLQIWDTDGNSYSINTDGLKGELTEKEWREDETIKLFDKEGQDKIIDTLLLHEII
jgi:hypothetical protein